MRASPCIGVCSTTYGDLVCRGCSRFAHEVVQWNNYAEDQRVVIWQRLNMLRDGAVAHFLASERVVELCRVDQAKDREFKRVRVDQRASADQAYLVLRRLARQRLPLPWRPKEEKYSARELLVSIDREIYNRSLAVYERSFKVPAGS